eukprot:3639112-Amphidinium_carterae.1
MLANANDRMRASEHQTNLLGQRLRQVTDMHEVSMAEVQAELEELEASSSPDSTRSIRPILVRMLLKLP